MSGDVVESFEINGLTVEIVHEGAGDGAGDPRDADNLGVMIATGHRNYTLGDESHKGSIPEYAQAVQALNEFVEEGEGHKFIQWVKDTFGATVVLPLWLLDHSGLSMSTRSFTADPEEWDSGIVGFIFDTTRTREMTGVELADVQTALTHEVADYDKYLQGEVYGYRVLDPDGTELDSCWGFLGLDDVDGYGVKANAIESASEMDAPKWVAVAGGVSSRATVYGPYDSKGDAETDRPGAAVMLLTPPPAVPYRLTAGPDADVNHPAGTTITVELTRQKLAELLAKGWVLDN